MSTRGGSASDENGMPTLAMEVGIDQGDTAHGGHEHGNDAIGSTQALLEVGARGEPLE